MSTSRKRIHLYNVLMKYLFSFPNNERIDFKSCNQDTKSIYEQQKLL